MISARPFSRLIVCCLAVPLTVAAGPVLTAHADPPPPTTAASTTVVDTDSASADEFTDAAPATEDKLSEVYLDQSAEMGVLVDDAEVSVARAPDVGFVVGTDSALGHVSSVSREKSEVTEVDGGTAEDVEYQLRTTSSTGTASTALPLGPGSLGLNFYDQVPCATLYGSDRGNWISACETLGYLDDGDGRHKYGVADDDGSSKYDWFAYHQWGTVRPSDSGADWIITKGRKTSYINGASIANGDPGYTDYAPNASTCDGALTIGMDFVFNFKGTLCTSGTEIEMPDAHGSFGQHLNIGTPAPVDSKPLDYRIAVRIKQGVKPDWYTVNIASFRKQLTTTTETINDIT